MFTDFEWLFPSSSRSPGMPPGNAKVDVFTDCCTIVERARAVRMSLGATPEAQGARRSGRTDGPHRGLSARAKPRVGKGVKQSYGIWTEVGHISLSGAGVWSGEIIVLNRVRHPRTTLTTSHWAGLIIGRCPQESSRHHRHTHSLSLSQCSILPMPSTRTSPAGM